jgi:hypothetical protein
MPGRDAVLDEAIREVPGLLEEGYLDERQGSQSEDPAPSRDDGARPFTVAL